MISLTCFSLSASYVTKTFPAIMKSEKNIKFLPEIYLKIYYIIVKVEYFERFFSLKHHELNVIYCIYSSFSTKTF